MSVVSRLKYGVVGMLCSGLWASVVPESHGQLVLNEVMADNRQTLLNVDEYPDWVEVRNSSASTINLVGWTLTDNLSQPTKFVFPAGIQLDPGQALIVFCDSSFGLPGLHTGFGLDSEGELVALFQPSNLFTPLQLITFGRQLADYSIGRLPDSDGPWDLNQPTPGQDNIAAVRGGLTNLFINEWMADPSSGDDWLELYNSSRFPVSIGSLVWTDDSGFPGNPALPILTFIEPEGFMQFIADGSPGNGWDHLDFRLSAGGETVTLYAPDRATPVDQVTFLAQSENISEGRLPDGDANIVPFPVGRDTPGSSNLLPLTNVVVNEVLTHSDPPFEDAIELRNLTPSQIDISHWWLTNGKNTPRKYRIPANTFLPPFGFKVFYEYQFNPDFTGDSPSFSLNSARGDEVYIYSGDATGRLTGLRGGVEFGPTENAGSLGRYTDSLGQVLFLPLRERTFGADNPASLAEFRTGTGFFNAPPLVGPVLINEVMYHPLEEDGQGDNTKDEYIELLNITNITVTLYDPFFPTNTWKLSGGVDYVFPRFVSIPPEGVLLLVNFNPLTNPTQLAAFRNKYQVPPNTLIFGPYSGKLDNREESIRLFKPDTPQPPGRPDAGLVPFIPVDRLDYEDRDPWPEAADNTGLALQRTLPEDYGNDPINWQAAPPTPGWVPILLENFRRAGSVVSLDFRRFAGRSYTLQSITDPSRGNWSNRFQFPTLHATQQQQVADPIPPGIPSRFYRLVSPAQP